MSTYLTAPAVRLPVSRLPVDLDALFAAMRTRDDDLPEWSELPNYGGAEPNDTECVWSWDATRQIVGTCADDLRIVSR